jgi:hypothetical protein
MRGATIGAVIVGALPWAAAIFHAIVAKDLGLDLVPSALRLTIVSAFWGGIVGAIVGLYRRWRWKRSAIGNGPRLGSP